MSSRPADTFIACDALAGLRIRTKDRGIVEFIRENPDEGALVGTPVRPRSPRPSTTARATVQTQPARRRHRRDS